MSIALGAAAASGCKDRRAPRKATEAGPAASGRNQSPQGAKPAQNADAGVKLSGGSDASGGARTSVTCPTGMQHVPGGKFWVGSPKGRGADDEHPRFSTTVADYCLDRTEVTAEAYDRCVQAGSCSSAKRDRRSCNGGRSARAKHPINCVDFAQAEQFCATRGARLPTELEWEYAARGGERQLIYPWGEGTPDGRTCWKHHGTCEVQSFAPGAFDLHDIVGNVWEWTQSWYGPYPWPSASGYARVYRGGSWSRRFEKWLSPTLRNRSAPHEWGSHLGFRCAKTPAEVKCAFGRAPDEGRCLHGVHSAECSPPRRWNGLRCAKPDEPKCREGWQERAGFGCVLEDPIEVAPETIDTSVVARRRSPRFDADCREHNSKRPHAYKLEGGTHKARNVVGARAGCKNRDVGVGWNSACCP